MKTAVVIGRFQPFHNGHLRLLQEAACIADKVIVIVGSSFGAINSKNPFTFEQRRALIMAATKGSIENLFIDLYIEGVADRHYSNVQWVKDVRDAVSFYTSREDIVLVGYEKDDTSFYLRMFPNWKLHTLKEPHVENGKVLNATEIRESIYRASKQPGVNWSSFVRELPVPQTEDYRILLSHFLENEAVAVRMGEEWEHLRDYRKRWAAAPFEPTFVTVDACVVISNHILLVKRRTHPGKGLYALPGGFLNQNERIEEGIMRELFEETRIGIRPERLQGMLRSVRVFDAPNRSLRGRSITHCGLFIDNLPALPKVRGSDDAERAVWVPVHRFFHDDYNKKMFEDHWSIVATLIGGL